MVFVAETTAVDSLLCLPSVTANSCKISDSDLSRVLSSWSCSCVFGGLDKRFIWKSCWSCSLDLFSSISWFLESFLLTGLGFKNPGDILRWLTSWGYCSLFSSLKTPEIYRCNGYLTAESVPIIFCCPIIFSSSCDRAIGTFPLCIRGGNLGLSNPLLPPAWLNSFLGSTSYSYGLELIEGVRAILFVLLTFWG